MAGNVLPLQYPVGNTNEALRSAIVRLVDVLRTLQTDVDQQAAIDALAATTTALSNTVSSNSTAISTAQNDITGLEGNVTNLEAADTALNSSVTSILESVGLIEGDVAALQSNELTAQERFEIALDHSIDTVQGSRREWQAYIEEQIVNVTDAIAQFARLQQDDTAAIVVEQTVRVTENEAFAQQVTAITADIANTNAAVVTEQTARANGDSALASDIASVTSTANGNTTSINTLTTSVNGISANWTVSLNVNNRVAGMVTLNGTQNTTAFSVLADKFQIVHPTVDGTTIQAFTTGLVDGISTVGMNGSVIIDGTLLARHIAAGQITTAKLAAGAVTAANINVASLTAITAAFGDATVTGELTGGASGKLKINFTTGRIRALA